MDYILAYTLRRIISGLVKLIKGIDEEVGLFRDFDEVVKHLTIAVKHLREIEEMAWMFEPMETEETKTPEDNNDSMNAQR